MKKSLLYGILAVVFGLLIGAALKIMTTPGMAEHESLKPRAEISAAIVNTSRREIEAAIEAAADNELPFDTATIKLKPANVRPTAPRDWRIRPKRFV